MHDNPVSGPRAGLSEPTGQQLGFAAQRRQTVKRPPKVAMAVAQRIVQEIAAGHYRPGTQLPSEPEMLAQYQVGRGALREALRFLELNGVIEMRIGPRGGPVATKPDATSLAGSLSLFLQLNRTTFDAIVQVCKVLEPPLAAMTAERIGAEEIVELREAVEAMRAGLGDERLFLAANDDFHRILVWSCGNTVFALLLASLHRITDGKALGVEYPQAQRKAILAAHQRIFDAIEARNPEAARDCMAAHSERYERYLSRYYPDLLSSLLHWGYVVS